MSAPVELDSLRQKVGTLDSKIVHLLNERALVSQEIGEVKKASERYVFIYFYMMVVHT